VVNNNSDRSTNPFSKLFEVFNPNARKSKLTEFPDNPEALTKRVCNIALPAIHMYQPLSGYVSAATTLCEFSAVMLKTGKDIYSLNGMALLQDGKDASWIATKVVGTLFFSKYYAIGFGVYDLTTALRKFSDRVHANDYRAAAHEFLNLTHVIANIGNTICPTPAFLVVTLLAQAAKEMSQAHLEFKKGRYLEGCANIAFAMIRLKAASPHFEDTFCKSKKEMTQDRLEKLLYEILDIQHDGQMIDFEALAKKHKYKNVIDGLSFDDEDLTHIVFKNTVFKNTTFKEADFKFSAFKSVTFTDCDLSTTRIVNSVFENSSFNKCKIIDSQFNWSHFTNTHFKDTDLTQTVFNDTEITNSSFTRCNLFESSFFQAIVKNSSILHSNLKDCLLFNIKKDFRIEGGQAHEITRPVIGLLYNFEKSLYFGELAEVAIRDKGGISFKIHYLPTEINTDKLHNEVKAKLAEYNISYFPGADKPSIAQYILRDTNNYSEINKINKIASTVAGYIDGLAIPGGADVEPELYGEWRQYHTHPDNTYLRSIFEFAMIDQAVKKEIPTLGICRGSQIVNVYYGGTLKQDVCGHLGEVHRLTLNYFTPLSEKTREVANSILGSGRYTGFHAYSAHHQASDKIGDGLEVALRHGLSPELLISRQDENSKYPTIVATQFHPEIYVLKEDLAGFDYAGSNEGFFTNLLERSRIYLSGKSNTPS